MTTTTYRITINNDANVWADGLDAPTTIADYRDALDQGLRPAIYRDSDDAEMVVDDRDSQDVCLAERSSATMRRHYDDDPDESYYQAQWDAEEARLAAMIHVDDPDEAFARICGDCASVDIDTLTGQDVREMAKRWAEQGQEFHPDAINAAIHHLGIIQDANR
jgi:hypothetical protein